MRRFVALAAVMVMAMTACTRAEPTSEIRSLGASFDPRSVTFSAILTPFDACDAVLAHFKAEALERVGPYGLDGGPRWYWFGEGDARPQEDSAGPPGDGAVTTVPTGVSPGTDGGFSGTNTQVSGVDEPDIIKTDGERILSIVDGKLRYVDVSGDEPVLLGQLQLETGWNHRFFVDGDRAFVFSQGDLYAIPMFAADAARIGPSYGMTVSVVQEIDLSSPADMEVVRTLRVDGSYLSARSIDGVVRMVVSSYPSDLPFLYPSNEAAEDIALAANRRIIEESTLETWVPSYTLYDADGDEIDSGFVVACDRMHRPAEFAGFDTLSVTTMDLSGALGAGNGTGVIARGETVYASTASLYVATNVWIPEEVTNTSGFEEFSERYETAVHKFDIAGDGPATYRASGSIDGHLLNQFSMDEFDGNLRIAITEGAPWSFQEDSESKIVVLTERDGALVEIGSVGNMGKGERIYSVRFLGETAYVVTFRQVDPLYVVDLRNPENPVVSGELKIPGYSAYLHPLGDGMLLGVGQEADSEGRTTGAKATLFDVSDPADPREISSWTIADAYSDVEWEHLAFLYWAPADMVVLPIQSWMTQFMGAVVLKTDDGLREYGRITHQREEGTGPETDCEVLESVKEGGLIVQLCDEGDDGGYRGFYCESVPPDEAAAMARDWGVEISDDELDGADRVEVCWPNYDMGDPQILRSLVIGDTLWTLSGHGLQANALDGLEVEHKVGF